MAHMAGREDNQWQYASVLKGGGLAASKGLARPLVASHTESVAAGATVTVTFTVPTQERYEIKSVTLQAVTGITYGNVIADGVDTKRNATFNANSDFGGNLVLGDQITVDVTNTTTGALSVTVDLLGLQIS